MSTSGDILKWKPVKGVNNTEENFNFIRHAY